MTGQLFKFKSNPKTIVATVPDSNLVQIQWSYEVRPCNRFLYRRDDANLIPLTVEERQALAKAMTA